MVSSKSCARRTLAFATHWAGVSPTCSVKRLDRVRTLVYLGLRSYRAIGVAWLMHAAWDLAHHLAGHPIWPYKRISSLGCMVFDSVIAVWFLADAPSILGKRESTPVASGNTPEMDATA